MPSEASLHRGDSVAVGLLANYGGKTAVALLTVFTLPVLYQQLHSEGFGLFGFFYSLLALTTLLDFGLSSAVQRDLAMQSTEGDPADRLIRMQRCIYSLELPVALIALALLLGVTAAAQWLASAWLQPRGLSSTDVAWSIRWMALAAVSQLLATYYTGCLNGLSQFKRVNGIQTGFALLRFAGMLTVSGWLIPNDHPLAQRVVEVFAVWALANLGMATFQRITLLRRFRGLGRPQLDRGYLRRAYAFGLSVAGVTLLIMVFNQVDKLAASRTLDLAQLGHYSMVWSLADVLYLFYFPIYTSFLPVFAARAGDATLPALRESIVLAWSCMSLAMAPAAISILLWPDYAIWAWTGDAALGSSWGYLLAVAIAGATFNAYLFVIFAVQQARGGLGAWTPLVALALVPYLPLSIGAMAWWGAAGGIIAWSTASIALASLLMHSCLSDEKYREIRRPLILSAVKTIAACTVAGLAIRMLLPAATNRWTALATLAAAACTLYLVAAAYAQRPLSARILRYLRAAPAVRGL